MAATISTYTLPVGFSRADVLTKLEVIFADLGYHAPAISGLATGLQSFTGGGTGTALAGSYYNASSTASTGSGSGATFYVGRNNAGNVSSILLNRPGQGYASGDTVIIPASQTGGAAAGATDITVVLDASTTVYGGPSSYFTKDLTRNDPWAVMRMEYDDTKAYGFTYRGLYINTNNELSFTVGSSFQPRTTSNYSNLGWGSSTSYRGGYSLDTGADPVFSSNEITPFGAIYPQIPSQKLWSSNSFSLDIIVHRSNLDPNCAVISFYQPDLSTSNLLQNTFLVFSINKYSTPLWDLDYVFMGGVNIFKGSYTPTNVDSYTTGVQNLYYAFAGNNYSYPVKRLAEYGFSRSMDYQPFTDSYWQNVLPDNTTSTDTYNPKKIYSRDSQYDTGQGKGPGATISSSANYRAIIKGLPISGNVAPCPYYFPDEFAMIDFAINVPSQNIQPGDTVTVSPSEVYTVITGGYGTDTTTITRGVLFVVRTT